MKKHEYQTRILKLEKTLEQVLEATSGISDWTEDERELLDEAFVVLYDEQLEEETDI